MGRPLRRNVPGIHHVWARGVLRRDVFADDHDRAEYLRFLAETVEKMQWACVAYCLMDTHVHLLVDIEQANLGRGMQRLHGRYGLAYNERHGHSGHVFESRYGSKLVTTDPQLWWTIAYIVHNPVEAGLCRVPEQWPWSSHAGVLRGTGPHWFDRERLLSYFDGLGGEPLRRYAQLTAGAARAY